jgi:uracil-DNA glycosylase family protein
VVLVAPSGASLVDPSASASWELVPRDREGGVAPLPRVAAAAARCRACPLGLSATQTVFGEGPARATFMMVGEQPGDSEDKAGHPFVGPAGGMLDRGLAEAGIDRNDVYVTNAVKHFSFVVSGKRRLHQKPKAREVQACKGWLAAEIQQVRPRLIICLGATAAQAIIGPKFLLTRGRGEILRPVAGAPPVMATYHPSALLRAPDPEKRHELYEAFLSDLRKAREVSAR